jgi:hypothetical protein
MAGAQTATNNQLKTAAAMATETATMTAATMTMKMGGSGSLAGVAAARRWQRQRDGG